MFLDDNYYLCFRSEAQCIGHCVPYSNHSGHRYWSIFWYRYKLALKFATNCALNRLLIFFAVICVLKELNGFSAKFLFFGACILGAVSSIFLIVFSIITGAQDGKF